MIIMWTWIFCGVSVAFFAVMKLIEKAREAKARKKAKQRKTMSKLKSAISAILTSVIIVMTIANAQATGLKGLNELLPDPTPTPEATPTPTPEPEPQTVPIIIPILPIEPESIATPASIIQKALRPRTASINLYTATDEEKLSTLESNMESITVSLTFVQKAKGYDISKILDLITQIRENTGSYTSQQLDALVNATSSIDNEIVMSIFSGAITQADIDRMATQLETAMRETEPIELTETTISEYSLGVLLGVLTGAICVLIWAVTFKQ